MDKCKVKYTLFASKLEFFQKIVNLKNRTYGILMNFCFALGNYSSLVGLLLITAINSCGLDCKTVEDYETILKCTENYRRGIFLS